MEVFRAGCAVNGERHGNHVRLFIENAQNARMAILHKYSGLLGRVHNFEGIKRRGQSGQHPRFVHGQVDRTELQ